jgi:hypothetical protein
MGYPALLHVLKHMCSRSQDAFDQLSLAPGAQARRHGRTWRRQADGIAGVAGHTVGHRRQQALDRRRQHLKGVRPRRDLPVDLDRHEVAPSGDLIDSAERGEAAGRQQPSAGIDNVPVGDQRAIGPDSVGVRQ